MNNHFSLMLKITRLQVVDATLSGQNGVPELDLCCEEDAASLIRDQKIIIDAIRTENQELKQSTNE